MVFKPLLIVALLLASVSLAQARCAWMGMDSIAAEHAHFRADVVFVGILLKVEKRDLSQTPSNASARLSGSCQDSDAQELDTVSVVSGGGNSRHRGEFLVDRYYKGAPSEFASRLWVRVQPHLPKGEAILVYARRDGDELRADGGCGGSAFTVDERSAAHLGFLDALPVPGSGGSVRLRGSDARQSALPAQTLHFEGPDGSLQVSLDSAGLGHVSGLAAGSYRLISAAAEGQVMLCAVGSDSPTAAACEQLIVRDRAVAHWHFVQQPAALVSIRLLDASGATVDVDAEVELLDPATGTPVDFVRAAPWQGRNAIWGHAQPGPVLPTLVLTAVEGIGTDRLTARPLQRDLNDSGAAWRGAPEHQLKPGPNQIDLVLPPGLQPVQIDLSLRFPATMSELQMGGVELLTRHSDGNSTLPRRVHFSCPRTHDRRCEHRFTALPGQSWRVDMLGHRFGGERAYLIDVTHTQRIELELTANAP